MAEGPGPRPQTPGHRVHHRVRGYPTSGNPAECSAWCSAAPSQGPAYRLLERDWGYSGLGLENRWGPLGPSWVRIPPPPLSPSNLPASRQEPLARAGLLVSGIVAIARRSRTGAEPFEAGTSIARRGGCPHNAGPIPISRLPRPFLASVLARPNAQFSLHGGHSLEGDDDVARLRPRPKRIMALAGSPRRTKLQRCKVVAREGSRDP